MKLVISLALLALFATIATAQVQTRLIDLRVDHFNPLDRRTFDARYFLNTADWFSGGPLFIFVPSRFEDYTEFLTAGAVYEIAHETNGMLAALEPRYYGESRPTADTSVENLQWLTIHQRLADLAQFIAFIKANYYGASNSRVILWGRGDGGSIALWARQKYPNLVDGVWASSAPLNAISQDSRFMPNLYNTFNSIGGPECGEIIAGAFRIMEESIRFRNTSYVDERLNLCTPIQPEIEEDVARTFFRVASVMGHEFLRNASYTEVDAACRTMLGLNTPDDPAENDLDAFARWFIDEYYNSIDLPCLRNDVIEVFQNTSWDSYSNTGGFRQDHWLECTQLGMNAVSNEGENHPFGWRFEIETFYHACAVAFDEELITPDFIEESVARTNEFFGGLNPHVYRAFLTHGEMDPQRHLGPNQDLNAEAPVVVMSLQSFGRDFGSPAGTDYIVLHETKARARELIIKWIFDSIGEDQQPTIVPITT